jgi:predicted CoA-binding protein
MITIKQAADEFLAQRRIAISGVSRRGESPANIIYRKLRDSGYEVFAVNPNAEEVEGDICFRNLSSIVGGVDAVVIATHPRVTPRVVEECIRLEIPRIWMHRAFGEGSVDDGAATLARQNGIEVIAGGCPMMYCRPVDFGHKCMRWILDITGGLPDMIEEGGRLESSESIVSLTQNEENQAGRY